MERPPHGGGAPAGRHSRGLAAVLNIADRTWPLLQRLLGGHAAIYRATRGRIGHRIPGLPPMLVLHHKGAKSGTERVTPLIYAVDGDDVVVVASKGGFVSHPAWLHNACAHPETVVQIGAERRPVRARVASPAERARLWRKAVETYGGFQQLQDRTEREIPLVVFERRARRRARPLEATSTNRLAQLPFGSGPSRSLAGAGRDGPRRHRGGPLRADGGAGSGTTRS